MIMLRHGMTLDGMLGTPDPDPQWILRTEAGVFPTNHVQPRPVRHAAAPDYRQTGVWDMAPHAYKAL